MNELEIRRELFENAKFFRKQAEEYRKQNRALELELKILKAQTSGERTVRRVISSYLKTVQGGKP